MRLLLPLLAALMLLPTLAAAQNEDTNSSEAVRVIRAARERCEAVQSGHYVMEKRMKWLSGKDTTLSRYTCDFRKSAEDTIFGMVFAMHEEWYDSTWSGFHIIYTGNEYASYNTYDSTGTIMPCELWADDIMGIKRRLELYAPAKRNCYPIPTESQLADSEYTFSVSEALLNGKPCHHVRALKLPENDEDTIFRIKCIRYEINLWLDTASLLPVKYDVLFVNLEAGGRDTTTQYEEYRLREFSDFASKEKLSLGAIPDYITLSNYVPYRAPEPLAEGEDAPDWALPTLDGDTIRLADLQGKVVLLDFFYKKCAPCLAAMPALQSIHERYKDRGVAVLGIDPMDDPVKDDIADFLARREITYTVLFSDQSLSQAYHVDAYPTLLFIDRQGKVQKVHRGFSKTLEATIEEQLKKMLQ